MSLRTILKDKTKLIDQIIHAQDTYKDNSGLVIQLRPALAKLSVVTLGQLATIVSCKNFPGEDKISRVRLELAIIASNIDRLRKDIAP